MSKTGYYGARPIDFGVFDLDFVEYMHYMYLPIVIDEGLARDYQESLPANIQFADHLIEVVRNYEAVSGMDWKYVYVTARRGYATPGNPLNRPGWHADGFGTEDVNYVWTDRYPTDFAIGDFGTVSDDHIESVREFAATIEWETGRGPSDGPPKVSIEHYPDKSLLRLDDRVIHAAPEIPAPGGERSFFKVSFSNNRYNLKGNSHNYGLTYDWPMFDRDAVRNDPTKAGGDSV